VTDTDLLIWGFGLIGAAFALGVLELFIPSMGIIAVTASILAVGGVVAFWQVSWVWGITALVGSVMGAIAMVHFAFKVMPYTPVGRGLILGPDDEEEAARKRDVEQLKRQSERALVGAMGVARTALRPVGTAEIDGKRYDVLAQGGSIDQGARVRVTGVEGTQIKVREVR